jgi:hypothetical protein
MSSADTASTMAIELRLIEAEALSEARMPDTTMAPCSAGASAAGWAACGVGACVGASWARAGLLPARTVASATSEQRKPPAETA